MTIVKNLFILMILVGVLYGVTQQSPFIKKQAEVGLSRVLGAKTSNKDATKPLPDALKDDAATQVDALKKQAMHIDLDDVMQSVKRLQKIPQDLKDANSAIQQQVKDYLHKK